MPAASESHAQTSGLYVLGAAAQLARGEARLFVRTELGHFTLTFPEQLAREVGRELLGLPAHPAALQVARTAEPAAPKRRPQGANLRDYLRIFAETEADPTINVSALCRQRGLKSNGYFIWVSKHRRRLQEQAIAKAQGGQP